MPQPDPHDLHEFGILQHVETTSRLNNRLAAQKLGVSIKLAHELLKRMVQKGLLHVSVVHSRRWDYFLTPKGIAEKTRLTLEFLDFSLHFYRDARRQSAALCRRLSENGVRTVSFLGAGELAEIVYLGVQEWGLKLAAAYADAGSPVSRTDGAGTATPPSSVKTAPLATFMGVPVQPCRELRNDRSDAIIVCLYDPQQPMRRNFLPADVRVHTKMHWIFEDSPAAAPVPRQEAP